MRARSRAFIARSKAPIRQDAFSPRIVIPDGAADPGPQAAKPSEVPALRFASAGMI
jgi:hypothetical protein